MRRTIAVLGLASLPLVPAAASLADEPASCRQIRGADTPEDPQDDVFVCRQDVWFHVGESPQLGNASAFGEGDVPSWDTTRPTGSAGDGAGGAYVASSALHQLKEQWDPRTTPRFEGRYTGDIDTLGMSFYLMSDANHLQGSTSFRTNLRLLVDDEVIYQTEDVLVPMIPEPDRSHRLDIALVNLHGTLEELGIAGGPKRSHRLTFSVVGTGLGTNATAFRYDTVEHPAGAIFNIQPDKLTGYTTIDIAPAPPA